MTPEEKRLDKYYQKKFGWTLEEVDKMFADQNNVCAACHRPPGVNRLSLDHDHAFDRVKIKIYKEPDRDYWIVAATPFSELRVFRQDLFAKKEVQEFTRRKLRRRSVRGGLCLRCNKGLQMFEDSKAPLPPPERLENLAAYLRKFQSKAPS